MPNLSRYFLILPCLFLISCQEAVFGIVNLPEKFSDIIVMRNIQYGDQPDQNLDIYLPEKSKEGEAYPVVIFFHGGRWTIGNKEQYQFMGYNFAQEGFITIVPNYRKYPAVKHPEFIQDAASVMAWAYQNISQYNGDIGNIFVTGHSSGAHIGAIAIADNSYLEQYNLEPDIIAAFAGLAGPYDFEPQADDLKDMFGPPENYRTMKVSSYIDGDEPPMLLLYGLDDKAVEIGNLERLATKINEQKGRVKVIAYEGVNHRDIIANMTWVSASEPYAMTDMLDFFSMHSR